MDEKYKKLHCTGCTFNSICKLNTIKEISHCIEREMKTTEKLQNPKEQYDRVFNMTLNAVKNGRVLLLVTNSLAYTKPKMVGDVRMKELANMYLEGRSKILRYSGPSKVDENLLLFYEDKLIQDNVEVWWHHYDKKYITNVLSLLSKLKVGIHLDEEERQLHSFYSKLSEGDRRYGRYGMARAKEVFSRVYKEV